MAGAPRILLLLAAISIFVTLSLFPLVGDSCVNDEIAHLPAGYTYWRKRDYRLNPEHPPLAKLLAGLPLQFLPVRWPEEDAYWQRGDEWGFGYRLLYHSGNDTDRMVFWGRFPMLGWGILLLISIYAVARELFGTRGALVSLVLATFCPELLAHSHLVNTDAPVAATMFLSIYCFWKFYRSPSLRWSVASGLTMGIALATKFSAVMLVPVLLWFLIVSFVAQGRHRDTSTAPPDGERPTGPRWYRVLLYLGLIATITFGVIWTSYGFRYRASPDPSFQFPWKPDLATASIIGKAISVARAHQLLPEAYLYGFSYFHDQSQARHAFALELYSDEGWGWYFPFAFLVKTPLPHLILYAWGLYWSYRRLKAGDRQDQFLMVPLIAYWVMAIMSRMNIGVRHILPVLPIMMVLAGGIEYEKIRPALKIWHARLLAGLLTAGALSVVSSAPFFLAYFNLPSRLLYDRHQMLVDSNLDWGQDLKRLKEFADRNKVKNLKLGYFGNASPAQLGLVHEQLPGSNMYKEVEREWKVAEEFLPGDWVAVSATNYVGLLIPERDFYLSRFGGRKPVATIGHSILIYHLPENPRGTP